MINGFIIASVIKIIIKFRGFDGPEDYNLMKTISAAAQTVSAKTGLSWRDDAETYRQAEAVIFYIHRIFCPLAPDEKGVPLPANPQNLLDRYGRDALAEILEKLASNVRGELTEEDQEQDMRKFIKSLKSITRSDD